ncbi:MAG TPA: glucans biosynthesis glucosyltransferase MdoH [Micropepsaceae bacterium]|nr:glucans biosynthesis glucosyltransferase MdoH [Micropepsaceae bacterium]
MPDISVRRWLFLGLVVSSTVVADQPVWSVIRVDGLSVLEIFLFTLFTILFAWIAASFWLACIGAYVRRQNIDVLPTPPDVGWTPPHQDRSRTAIVMPVFNESAARIFAGLAAIRESVRGAHGQGFDYFVLSDTTNPELQKIEEDEWRRLRDSAPGEPNIYYRHRPRNIGRKSGNIQDFCQNWGSHYDYMVVLDADSLMTGETLVRLVGLMDQNPRAALIQVPPQLIGRESLFARIQQFSSSVYGPCHAAGLAFLQGTDGNYWGHNAIIRVRAFIRHCGLPKLPGRAPLGGEILSHDFVEAALLKRAGWDVLMAPDLGGSYEEPPPTIFDYLKRDRRWCQGNLQHARLILAIGLRMPSRLHFLMGVMNYVASPLWLLMLITSAVEIYFAAQVVPVTYFGRYPVLSAPISHTVELLLLLGFTLAILYAPKLLALHVASRDPAILASHGGRLPLTRSVLLECLFSTLLAPVVMLSHSWFVFSILCGRTTSWGTQQRDDHALPFWFVARMFLPHTLAGIAATFALQRYLPGEFWWFVPFLLGLVLAIPLVYLTSSLKLGMGARRLGLFQTPGEVYGMKILDHTRAIMNAHESRYAGLAPRTAS